MHFGAHHLATGRQDTRQFVMIPFWVHLNVPLHALEAQNRLYRKHLQKLIIFCTALNLSSGRGFQGRLCCAKRSDILDFKQLHSHEQFDWLRVFLVIAQDMLSRMFPQRAVLISDLDLLVVAYKAVL